MSKSHGSDGEKKVLKTERRNKEEGVIWNKKNATEFHLSFLHSCRGGGKTELQDK